MSDWDDIENPAAFEGPDDRGGEPGAATHAPATIRCVDCGGTCHLLTAAPRDLDGIEQPFVVGDIVAYRCEDCLDRWDVELA